MKNGHRTESLTQSPLFLMYQNDLLRRNYYGKKRYYADIGKR